MTSLTRKNPRRGKEGKQCRRDDQRHQEALATPQREKDLDSCLSENRPHRLAPCHSWNSRPVSCRKTSSSEPPPTRSSMIGVLSSRSLVAISTSAAGASSVSRT